MTVTLRVGVSSEPKCSPGRQSCFLGTQGKQKCSINCLLNSHFWSLFSMEFYYYKIFLFLGLHIQRNLQVTGMKIAGKLSGKIDSKKHQIRGLDSGFPNK
jgi:hypothetical protein